MSISDFSQPLVSVIIPTYNQPAYLQEAVESILAQTYHKVEVIVVDDGSTAETRAAIAPYVERQPDRVKYFYQENAGTPAARNVGIRHAQGELLALLDHDDRWLPHKLERQVPTFLNDSEVGLAYAGIHFFRTSDGSITAEYFPGEDLNVHDVLGHRVLTVQTMLFRRSVVETIGGFDESLPGADDWDFSIRVAARFKLFGLDEVLGEARLHDNNQGANTERMVRNASLVLEKNSNIHDNCAECTEAIKRSKAALREIRYQGFNSCSKALWQNRQYWQALSTGARALWCNPSRSVTCATSFG